jgi:hypothetical protein
MICVAQNFTQPPIYMPIDALNVLSDAFVGAAITRSISGALGTSSLLLTKLTKQRLMHTAINLAEAVCT